jgi:hypothetical protein
MKSKKRKLATVTYICRQCKKPILGKVMYYGSVPSETNCYHPACYNP